MAGTLSSCQDGNDVEQIYDAVQLAYDTKGVPTCIVLNTVKGLGATFAEGTGAHSSQPTKEQWDEAIAAAGEEARRDQGTVRGGT